MKKISRFFVSLIFIVFILLLFVVQGGIAQIGSVRTRISVTSATSGTLISSTRRTSTRVQVASAAAVPVWFCDVDSNVACSAVTVTNGCVKILAGAGYVFTIPDEGWGGPICALLDSGVTAVNVDVRDF